MFIRTIGLNDGSYQFKSRCNNHKIDGLIDADYNLSITLRCSKKIQIFYIRERV